MSSQKTKSQLLDHIKHLESQLSELNSNSDVPNIKAENLLRIQRDLSVAIGQVGKLEDIMGLLLDHVIRIEEADSGGVYIRDTNDGSLKLIASRGLSKDFVKAVSLYNGNSRQAKLVAKGEAVYKHYSEIQKTSDEKQNSEGLRGLSIIPIKHDNDVIAVMNVGSHKVDKMSPPTRHAIESIAGMIGGFIARAKAEARSKEADARIRAVMESSKDIMIFSLDREYRYTSFNQAHIEFIKSMFEIDIKLGMNILEFLKPAKLKRLGKLTFDKVLKGENFIETFEQKEYGLFYEFVGNPIRDDTNNTTGIAVFIRNITERKLIEEKLRQSEKMEVVGQLAGGIAHDFNNQLTGILGYAEMIRDHVEDNPLLSTYSENILTSVKRAADLTAQLLAFSRKGNYLSVTIDVHQIIDEVMELLKHSIDKRIRILQFLNAEICTVKGDPSQIQNSILNLALNARDAMPNGGKLGLSTRLVNWDETYCKKSHFHITPGDFIEIAISDNGIGMDTETQSHIFEPFFTTKMAGKGTGMGLAAVYGTINSHQGAIDFNSVINEGSTFRLFFPIVKDPEFDATNGCKTEKPIIRGSAHILLVDDEKMIRKLFHDIAISLGYQVSVCENGKKAVELYKKSWREIDLVILDMMMPVMDGRETFVEMKEINPDIVALMSSGYSIESRSESILAEGIRGFIQKPFKLNELSRLIADLLIN